jgi:hypothetical protein
MSSGQWSERHAMVDSVLTHPEGDTGLGVARSILLMLLLRITM